MTTQLVEERKGMPRLKSKLEEFERQLESDSQTVLGEIKILGRTLKNTLSLSEAERLELESESLIKYEEILKEINQLELQIELANMETLDVYNEKKGSILKQLDQLQHLLKLAEEKRYDFGALVLRSVRDHAEKLEDKIEGLHLRFTLSSQASDVYEEKRNEIKHSLDHISRVLHEIPDRVNFEAKDMKKRCKGLSDDVVKALKHFFE